MKIEAVHSDELTRVPDKVCDEDVIFDERAIAAGVIQAPTPAGSSGGAAGGTLPRTRSSSIPAVIGRRNYNVNAQSKCQMHNL